MKLSRLAKATLTVGAIVVLLGFVLIVDLGVNAGRIHYGVEIRGGLEVGGLTRAEANEVLLDRTEEMRYEPIVLGGKGITVRFYPNLREGADGFAVGWQPRRGETIQAALDVGREDAPFGALVDRWRAWVTGVTVPLQGRPFAPKVTKLIDSIERKGEARGYELDRPRLRFKIRRVLNRWPRRSFYRIPFSS